MSLNAGTGTQRGTEQLLSCKHSATALSKWLDLVESELLQHLQK